MKIVNVKEEKRQKDESRKITQMNHQLSEVVGDQSSGVYISHRLEFRSIYHIDQSSGVYISHRLDFRSIYVIQVRVKEYISHIDQSSGVYIGVYIQIRVQEFISHIDKSSGVYISHRLEFRSIYLTQISVQEYITHIRSEFRGISQILIKVQEISYIRSEFRDIYLSQRLCRGLAYAFLQISMVFSCQSMMSVSQIPNNFTDLTL